MADDSFDVFISYRRGSSAAEARLIRSELQQRALRVFLDVEDLHRGYFDEALLRYIESAPNFLVILAPDSLTRCSNPDDWFRREIEHAIQSRRNILPILLRGFEFPAALDSSIQELPRHQGVEYSHTFFKAMIERILEGLETKAPAAPVNTSSPATASVLAANNAAVRQQPAVAPALATPDASAAVAAVAEAPKVHVRKKLLDPSSKRGKWIVGVIVATLLAGIVGTIVAIYDQADRQHIASYAPPAFESKPAFPPTTEAQTARSALQVPSNTAQTPPNSSPTKPSTQTTDSNALQKELDEFFNQSALGVSSVSVVRVLRSVPRTAILRNSDIEHNTSFTRDSHLGFEISLTKDSPLNHENHSVRVDWKLRAPDGRETKDSALPQVSNGSIRVVLPHLGTWAPGSYVLTTYLKHDPSGTANFTIQ